MKAPRSKLAAVLAERTLKPLRAKRFSDEVAAYLLAEGRTAELNSLMRDIMQYRTEQGVVEVNVVSAHPLTEKERTDIHRQVKILFPAAQHIILTETLDSTLVGGIKIEFANQQLDMSVRAKLNQLKQLTALGA